MKKNSRVVIKVGTKVITAKDRTLDLDRLKGIVSQIADLKDEGAEVILVTSGAIGAGMGLLGVKKRSTELSELQATASIGQSYLMQQYNDNFRKRGYFAGQILLTQEDLNDRKRYLNIRHTIEALLRHKAVPIINENDTVATEEIKCGDNDRLASLVSDICKANKLILLTDVDGLLDENGSVVHDVLQITPKIMKLCGVSDCDLGTGGMVTKLESARIAMNAGIDCVIANGKVDDIISKIFKGEVVGTTFTGGKADLLARKRWIAFSSNARGVIGVDDGARSALVNKNKSLLASGIISVSGNFRKGDVVKIVDMRESEIARGVVNYSAGDLSKIKGLRTADFKSVLEHVGPDEVVHKDNLVIV